jgi:hypothetical protein
MIKWEYKTMFGNLSDRQLNKLGNEGWELVAVEPNENLMLRRYYFKRIRTIWEI